MDPVRVTRTPPLSTLLWLGHAFMIVHNAEELLTVGPFLDAHRASPPT